MDGWLEGRARRQAGRQVPRSRLPPPPLSLCSVSTATLSPGRLLAGLLACSPAVASAPQAAARGPGGGGDSPPLPSPHALLGFFSGRKRRAELRPRHLHASRRRRRLSARGHQHHNGGNKRARPPTRKLIGRRSRTGSGSAAAAAPVRVGGKQAELSWRRGTSERARVGLRRDALRVLGGRGRGGTRRASLEATR